MDKLDTTSNSRNRRYLLRQLDEAAFESASNIDRILAWSRWASSPNRISRILRRLPAPIRRIAEIGYKVLAIVILIIPAALILFILYMQFSMHFVSGFILNRERPDQSRPSELVKNVRAGAALSVGGKKGGASKARLEPIRQRDEKILDEARRLLTGGHELSEIPGILVRRYSGRPGYPTTDKQYRNIIRPLRSN